MLMEELVALVENMVAIVQEQVVEVIQLLELEAGGAGGRRW